MWRQRFSLSRLRLWLRTNIKDELEPWKDAAAALQSFITVLALIVGAYWTYTTFITTRQDRPRLTITHSASHFPISDHRILLSVSEKLTNPGAINVEPREGLIRIDQVLPVPASVEEKLKSTSPDPYPGGNPCLKQPEKGTLNDTALDACVWPIVAFHMHYWTKDHPLLLEPGEVDTVQNFFIIPDSIQVVYILSAIRSPADEGILRFVFNRGFLRFLFKKPTAWRTVTVYDLRQAK
jgi:hypothetical protein